MATGGWVRETKNRAWSRSARFLISCPAMSDAGLASFDADATWSLVHGTPGSALIPHRSGGGPAATFEEVTFLAECISFDHDMPTVVRPWATTRAAKVPAPMQPLLRGPGLRTDVLSYFDAIEAALSSAWSLRLGDASLALRYLVQPSLAGFSARFDSVREGLALYAMATRQVETMGEYLCLFRVLEWADGRNGVTLASAHLSNIGTHPFGNLMSQAWPKRRVRRANVFALYRRKALRRLAAFRARGESDTAVAQHLYAIRCELAHGARTVRLDRPPDVAEVARDLPIVKMLARLAIEAPKSP